MVTDSWATRIAEDRRSVKWKGMPKLKPGDVLLSHGEAPHYFTSEFGNGGLKSGGSKYAMVAKQIL